MYKADIIKIVLWILHLWFTRTCKNIIFFRNTRFEQRTIKLAVAHLQDYLRKRNTRLEPMATNAIKSSGLVRIRIIKNRSNTRMFWWFKAKVQFKIRKFKTFILSIETQICNLQKSGFFCLGIFWQSFRP